jgi:hypothetical protein
MASIQQLLQARDPTRQLRTPFRVEQPTHLPELLLRVPDVQGQYRSGEQPTELLLQALLAIDHDLTDLVGLGREATPRRLVTRPVHRRVTRAERPVHLLVARAVQPTVHAPAQGVHHHQGGTPAILALVPFLAPWLAPPALPPGAAPMPLASATAAAGMARPGAAASLQLLLGSRRRRLAVDLHDQHLTIILGQGAGAEVDEGGPGQPQDPLLDGRDWRRAPQEHRAEAAGQPEADPGGQAAQPADHQGAVSIAGQAQLDIQRMHAGTTAAARHEEGSVIGDRAATGLQRPPSLGVGQAIATGLGPWGQVQSIVAGTQEQLDQQTAQRSEELPEGLLKFQEGGGRRIAEAEVDDPVELAVELLPSSPTVGGRVEGVGLFWRWLIGADS